jgi:hypothetical protein
MSLTSIGLHDLRIVLGAWEKGECRTIRTLLTHKGNVGINEDRECLHWFDGANDVEYLPWTFMEQYVAWLEKRLQNRANLNHSLTQNRTYPKPEKYDKPLTAASDRLIPPSGLTKNPHEGSNSNYGDNNHRN